MFRRAKKELKRPLADPLDAVPVQAERVEAKSDERGCLQLRRLLPPTQNPAERLLRWARLRREQRVNLDQVGSFFWGQIDGRRTLHEIAAMLQQQYQLQPQQAKHSAVAFTRLLMLRNLIGLAIPGVRNP